MSMLEESVDFIVSVQITTEIGHEIPKDKISIIAKSKQGYILTVPFGLEQGFEELIARNNNFERK